MSEDVPVYGGADLPWRDVADGAAALFRVWENGTELRWAEEAWKILAQADLTRWREPMDYLRVQLRLAALAFIYRDFCQLGRDEIYDEVSLAQDAIDVLNISRFRLGQMLGTARFYMDQLEFEDDEMVAELALIEMSGSERCGIRTALLQAYGSECKMVEALFATSGVSNRCSADAGTVGRWIATGMKKP